MRAMWCVREYEEGRGGDARGPSVRRRQHPPTSMHQSAASQSQGIRKMKLSSTEILAHEYGIAMKRSETVTGAPNM